METKNSLVSILMWTWTNRHFSEPGFKLNCDNDCAIFCLHNFICLCVVKCVIIISKFGFSFYF